MLIYQTEDGQTKIETRLENETVWLTQMQMSELFQRDRSVITKHINNIFKDCELDEKSNVQNLHISSSDKPVKYYNLDVIISVGYRVKSLQGTKFRQWPTARLKEYIVKGFTEDAGKISHKIAIEKANNEYLRYKSKTKNEVEKVERDFVKHIEKLSKQIK